MTETVKAAAESPKTTLAALAVLCTAAAYVLAHWSTGVDWSAVMAMVVPAAGFFFAKDAS